MYCAFIRRRRLALLEQRRLDDGEGGWLRAAIRALESGELDAVARPWDRPYLDAAPGPFEVAGHAISDGADPPVLVVTLTDDRRLLFRAVEDGWRLARLLRPHDPAPVLHPEAEFRFPAPRAADGPEGLRWLCLALEDLSELLGDRIFTLPGRPMESFSEDVGGQGERRDVERSAWFVGPSGHLSVERAEHEIFDGATPRWTLLTGLVHTLKDDAGARINVSYSAGSEPVARVLLSAPRPTLDAALEHLNANPGHPPGARAFPDQEA